MPNHALELIQVGYFEVELKNATHFVFTYLATTYTNILTSTARCRTCGFYYIQLLYESLVRDFSAIKPRVSRVRRDVYG